MDTAVWVVVLVAAALLICALAGVRLSTRLGIPALLIFLAIGLVAGNEVTLEPELVETIGMSALAIIIAEGGFTTTVNREFRRTLPVALSMSTLGVLVSVAFMTVAGHILLGLDWKLAVLLAGAVSSTDAAAVFSTLRKVKILPRLSAALETESGTNDPLIVVIVLLASTDDFGKVGVLEVIGDMVYQLAVGSAMGIVVGLAGVMFLRYFRFPTSGLYPLAVLAFCAIAFAAPAVLHASGFVAVYLAGLILGNAGLPHRNATVGFAEGVAWLAQIGVFILLGVLEFPHRLPSVLGPALVLLVVVTFLARPLSILISVGPFRWPWRQQAFLSWAGLRGAVPAIMAIIPFARDVPGAQHLFDIVFVYVLVTTLVLTPTLVPLGRRLGVLAESEPQDLHVESAPLERMQGVLLQLHVPPGSRLHGVDIEELRLPRDATVALIVRDDHVFSPSTTTFIEHGDDLLIICTRATRAETERRLRAVSHGGRLARWRHIEP